MKVKDLYFLNWSDKLFLNMVGFHKLVLKS